MTYKLNLSFLTYVCLGISLALMLSIPQHKLQAQDAPKEASTQYSLEFSGALDLGVLNSPVPIQERVFLQGANQNDQISAQSLRYTKGIFVQANLPNKESKRSFDVFVTPNTFEPGNFEDTLIISINGKEELELVVQFEVAFEASKQAFSTFVIYAREGDASTPELFKIRENLELYPRMNYKLEVKLLHEAKAEYEERMQKAIAQGSKLPENTWPALFVGPLAFQVGELNVLELLQAAIEGQSWQIRGQSALPVKPLVLVSARNLDEAKPILEKIRQENSQVVWLLRPLSQELMAEEKLAYTVLYPKAEGETGRLAAASLDSLETTLNMLLGQPLPKGSEPENFKNSGNEMSSKNYHSTQTTLSQNQTDKKNKTSENSTPSLADKNNQMILILVLGGIFVFAAIGFLLWRLQKQQKTLEALASQSLNKSSNT